MRRLLHLLYWQAQFDNRRPLLWLCGACYVLAAGPLILAACWLLQGRLGFRLTGLNYLSTLTTVNAVGAVTFVSYRASRTADERATGFLAIVQMTDLSPATLIAFRLLGSLAGLFPLWLLRFPFYLICNFLGGVRPIDFLMVETLLALVAITAAAIAILGAQVSRSSQAALFIISSAIILSQAVFYFPRLMMGLLRIGLGTLPPALEALNEQSLAFSQWSLAGRIWSPPLDVDELVHAAPGLAFHLVAAITVLFVAWRLAYANVLPAEVESRPGIRARPPRRVSGEALAWQAENIHLRSGRLRLASQTLSVALLLAMVAATFTVPPIAAGVLAMVIAGRAITVAASRGSVCVFNEIRDQTLSTLALLPREPLEFYTCWQRGAVRTSRVEYVTAAIGAPLIWWNMGDFAPGFLGILLALGLMAPFAFMNSLCRFEWRVAWLALWMFPLGMACVSAGFIVASFTTPWIGLLAFAMLAPLYQRLILRQIPHYFQRSVERL